MDEIHDFSQEQQTLMLSTVDKLKHPHMSYASFVSHKDCFYVLISTQAKHTINLLDNPKAAVMLIQDEVFSKQIFARKRVTFNIDSRVIQRDTKEWHKYLYLMENKFGNIIRQLSNLADFLLFELKTDQGRYVKGFGKAYNISHDPNAQFEHVNRGHQPINK